MPVVEASVQVAEARWRDGQQDECRHRLGERRDRWSGRQAKLTLSLNDTGLSDLSGLDGVRNPKHLFFERNKITNLTPLLAIVKRDAEVNSESHRF